MAVTDLETKLKRRLDKMAISHKSQQKARYELAKSLGFTTQEAVVLQNWSESNIKDLARQRGYISSPGRVVSADTG